MICEGNMLVRIYVYIYIYIYIYIIKWPDKAYRVVRVTRRQ